MTTPGNDTATPPPGIQQWRNARNGFTVLRLHYSADPHKRTGAWKATAQQGLSPRAWRREYEIDWAAPEGEAVIPEFDPQVHTATITPDPHGRLLRFWDPGFVSPAVLFAQLTALGQLRILAELCPFNTPLDQLIPMVWAMTDDLVGHRQCFDAGDPAAESEQDLGSVRRVLQLHGIMLRTNRPGTEVSYRELRARFLRRLFHARTSEHLPAILIDAGRCPTLIQALAGAFHRSHHPPYRPIKEHPYADVVDALRYGNDNLALMNQDYQKNLSSMARSDWAWT